MRRAASELVANINVTPLVDVCLVLLIIFMVVTPLINSPVALPESRTATVHPEDSGQLSIIVNQDGTLFVGPVAIRREQLQSELRGVFERRPGAEVIVRADRQVRYGVVLDVLTQCREAGFKDVGILTVKARQV
jgi:biopolymer transport protein ExbD